MATFFCKLVPPRPTFALDMTEDELALMQAHGEYWKRSVDTGQVVAFGLVGDPSGPYGIGILEVEDERAARGLYERRSRDCGEPRLSLRDRAHAVRRDTPLIVWPEGLGPVTTRDAGG